VHVIAIVNRKGGSGKTTTAFNLTGALAERGLRVLAVDLDPQGSLSRQGFGVESGQLTLSQVFDRRGEGFSQLVQRINGLERVHVVPGDRELNAIDRGLSECWMGGIVRTYDWREICLRQRRTPRYWFRKTTQGLRRQIQSCDIDAAQVTPKGKWGTRPTPRRPPAGRKKTSLDLTIWRTFTPGLRIQSSR
jgi:hypothetical protein